MFCPKCGTKNEGDAKFCMVCGAEMIDNQSKQHNPSEIIRGNVNQQLTKTTEGFKQFQVKSKALPKAARILPVVAVLLIVVIFVLFSIGKYITSPTTIVKNYFTPKTTGDWSKMFSYLALQESEFINEESFSKYMDNEYKLEIVSFEVAENPLPYNSELIKTYTVNYVLKGGSHSQTENVSLVKQSKKKFLLYDNYKVIAEGMTVSDYRIYAPHGAAVYIDDIKLAKPPSNNQDGIISSDIYVVSQVFAGIHSLKVKHPEYEDYVEQLYIYEYYPNEYYTNNLVLKEDTARADTDYNTDEKSAAPAQDLMMYDENAMFASGNGTAEFPYVIITAKQLFNVQTALGSYFELAANIDVTGFDDMIGGGAFTDAKEWDAWEGFRGVFDGSGYTISGLHINSITQCSGLFGSIEKNGVIKNLNISGSASTNKNDVNNAIGLLAGFNEGYIDNCVVQGDVRGDGRYAMVGGLVGTNSGVVLNCTNKCTVSGEGETVKVGGLVGINLPNGQVESSTNYGYILSDFAAGGIIGWDEGYSNNNSDLGTIVKDGRVSTPYPELEPDYIIPESSVRELTEADVSGLTPEELRLARNEIYARYGRQFNDQALQDYFNGKSWYAELPKLPVNSEPVLTALELQNIDLMKVYEAR